MDEPINFDFSGRSKEEVLSAFFYEIRGPLQIVIGHLETIEIAELSEEDTQRFIHIALKGAQFIQTNLNQVIQFLEGKERD